MNRIFKGLLFLLLTLALLCSVSCTQEQDHEHTYSESWTCDSQYHWHESTCGHEDAKGSYGPHVWGDVTLTKDPTCTEAGEGEVTCTVCGMTTTQSIPATGHTYAAEWSYNDNYHWHASTCEHEGLKGSFEPHKWDNGVITVQPTCEADGAITYTCKCGATKTEPVSGHTFATTWTSDDDFHWHAATCGHDAVSEKEEHTWGTFKNNGNGTATYTCSVCGKEVTKILPTTIRMVNAGPGEDASTGIVISWHAESTGSYLEYTDADGEDFNHAIANTLCNEELSDSDWRDTKGNKLTSKHYVCKVYLDGLTPDSTYRYRVNDGHGNVSETGTFRTAEAGSTYFQFMWLSDNHVPKGGTTTLERVRELVNFAQAKDDVDLDFVIFTGDMVNKGQIYEHWNYWSDSGLLNDMTYAFVCGNHDYYGWNDKNRTTNDYYKEFAAYPANNTAKDKSVLDSNYWFIWNRVLFICIDNFTIESEALQNLPGAKLSDQQAWFKAVCEENEGKYDYLIYAQHLPWFNTDTKACDYGYYSNWYKLFDTYKVDFALSSDEHHYRRTYALYNNKNPDYVSASNPNVQKAEMTDGKVSKGTVYVTSNLTEGGSLSSLKNEVSSGLKYIEYSAGGVGGVYFTVTPDEMTLHLIGSGGREFDTITVLKKTR